MVRFRWCAIGLVTIASSGCSTLAQLPLVGHLFDRTSEAVVIDESVTVSDAMVLPHGPIIAAPPGHGHGPTYPNLAPAVPAPGSLPEVGPPPAKVPPPAPNLVQPQPTAKPLPASPSSFRRK